MYRGKTTCKILKEIRKQLAKENDIAFVTSECKYQGDCLGTCPACEAEVRYLEEELRKRRQMGKTAIVTGVSLGLAASFMGCHFSNNAENPATGPSIPEPTKQENLLSSETSSAENASKQGPKKSSRSGEKVSDRSTDRYYDFSFGGILEEPPKRNTEELTSDTINIVYEAPEFEPDGTISATRISLPKDFGDVCLHPFRVPYFPKGQDSCKAFIQQHIRISSKIAQALRNRQIFFVFTIEKNGRIGKVHTICTKTESKIYKRWNKQCENATKKAIKAMPRWVPGKDEKGFPVRCYKSGDVIIGDSIQVWFNN